MAVCGPVARDDVCTVHERLRRAAGIRRNFRYAHRGVAIGNEFTVARPYGTTFLPTLSQPCAYSPFQVVHTNIVLAVVFIIRIDGQRATVGRELWALVTDLGKLTHLFSVRVVPHEPGGSVSRRLETVVCRLEKRRSRTARNQRICRLPVVSVGPPLPLHGVRPCRTVGPVSSCRVHRADSLKRRVHCPRPRTR